jgi:MFS family permease
VLFAALDDAIPLYPVYPLLFADHGLSAGRISGLFVLWSVTAFALEVPSGALADMVSRRMLLAAGALLRAVGFALWVIAPGYLSFAAGFVLWGAGGALTSGTGQALVYDGLAALGRAHRYPRLMGRAGTARWLGNAVACAAAAPLIAAGGYLLAGWVSAGVCLAAAAVALSFPPAPRAESTGAGGYLATLRAGLREAATHRVVRAAILLAAVLPGLWAIDEYLPLLAGADGVPAESVPLLLVPMVLGQAAGSALAGRCGRLRPAAVAGALAAGALLLAAGALVRQPAGFIAITVAMGTLALSEVLVDARLQDSIAGPARATVTSVAGFGAEVVAVLLFGCYGLAASAGLGVATLVACFAVPLGLVAAVTPRWLPAARMGG